MAVSSSTNSATYTGNNSTTVFAVPFKFMAATDLVVSLTPSGGTLTVKTLTTDYTVSGAGVDGGGSVTFVVAPPSGAAVYIYRATPLTQPVVLAAQGPFPPKAIEGAFDRVTMLVQDGVGAALQLASDVDAVEGRLLALEAIGAEARLAAVEARASVIEAALEAVTGGSFSVITDAIQQLDLKREETSFLDVQSVTVPADVNAIGTISGLVITVGDGGAIKTAPDPRQAWTSRTSGTAVDLYDIATGGTGGVVVVGDYDGAHPIIRTSNDGITWTTRTNTATTAMYRVAYGNGVFVTVGNGQVLVSADQGVTWTKYTVAGFHEGVLFGGGIFLAWAGNAVKTSTDGVTWTSRAAMPGAPAVGGSFDNKACIAYSVSMGRWFISLDADDDGGVWSTTDPTVGGWTLVDANAGNKAVAAFNSLAITCYSPHAFLVSVNGTSWSTAFNNAPVALGTPLIVQRLFNNSILMYDGGTTGLLSAPCRRIV